MVHGSIRCEIRMGFYKTPRANFGEAIILFWSWHLHSNRFFLNYNWYVAIKVWDRDLTILCFYKSQRSVWCERDITCTLCLVKIHHTHFVGTVSITLSLTHCKQTYLLSKCMAYQALSHRHSMLTLQLSYNMMS